jgi:hypothetical protein
MFAQSDVSQTAMAASASERDWNATLRRYRASAAHLIDQHVPSHGGCATCREVWPCPSALAAEFVLEL